MLLDKLMNAEYSTKNHTVTEHNKTVKLVNWCISVEYFFLHSITWWSFSSLPLLPWLLACLVGDI